MNRIHLSIAAAGLFAPSLFGQCALVDVTTPLGGNLFNRTIERVGDVTGDGIPDLAVGDPRGGAGSITIFSGATGARVFVIAAPAGSVFFGCTVANVGDLNGDGKPELAASTANTTTFPQGAVFVYSLATPAAPLMTITDPSVFWLGRQIAPAGDVDGDGTPDLLVAATHVALQGGEVQIRSGATGANIRTLQSGPPNEPGGLNSDFGIGLAGGVDISGDGVPDVVVGAPMFKTTGLVGRVKVYSGATGAVVRTELGTPAAASFGADVAFVPDLNQDGVADIAIGTVASWDLVAPTQGGVRIESGATGAVLRVHAGLTVTSRLGHCVRSLGDVDGDGVGDYGSTGLSYNCHTCSSPAIVWSGATGLEIVTLASHVTDMFDADDEYFCGIVPLADLDGDGAAEVAVLSENNPFAPTTNARLRVMRASAGTLNQAAMSAGCSPGASPYLRPALVVSGCLEGSGVVQLDAYLFVTPPLLFVSTATGSVPLPGGCALTVGAPAIVVPMPFDAHGHASLTAHIANLGAPITLYLQAIGKQTSPGVDFAATGRSTLTIP